jgi:hypothetical protein
MANNTFQLTAVSQNDPGSWPDGSQLTGTLTAYSGGTLESSSPPVNQAVSLPIPPPPGPNPPTPPTWVLVMDKTIKEASYTIVIEGPGQKPTTINIDGANMPMWVAQNKKEDTNQIYKEGKCGIFGYAQENPVSGQPINWIYTVTGGVSYPKVHPNGNS